MDMIVAHTIGWMGTALDIGSYQCKSSRKLALCQVVGGICYLIHYAMLDAYAGAGIMVFAVLSNILVCYGGGEGWSGWEGWKWLLAIGIASSLFFTWHGLTSLLPCIAALSNHFARLTRNGKVIRLTCLCISCPCWLAYNFLSHSWSGVFCEAVTLGSIFISILRYGMKTLDQVD